MDDLDPELQAMATVSKALNALEDDQSRARVLRWAGEKFAVSATKTITRPEANEESDEPFDSQQLFEHFVDLYDAVSPTLEVDRAITAAYWLQVLHGQDSWQSLTINNLLKDTGNGVTKIARALLTAQDKKPSLVRQMSKSGKAAQGRKTYKLTSSGISHVEAMLNK